MRMYSKSDARLSSHYASTCDYNDLAYCVCVRACDLQLRGMGSKLVDRPREDAGEFMLFADAAVISPPAALNRYA